MELLLLMLYAAACWAVFKIFRIPLNKWSVPTAVLGGVVFIATLVLVMNYNHPYSTLVRDYYVTTPIVPNVRGRVIEVPVQANQQLQQGDVLFRIDPEPYQLEVDRLEGSLAEANSHVAQLEQQLRAAEAASAEARSNILVAESEYEREARDALAQAQAEVTEVESQLILAQTEEERDKKLVGTGAVAQVDYDRAKRQLGVYQARLEQAKAAEEQAAEQIAGGSARLQAEEEQLHRAEAEEREARVAFEAESAGINPEVRQITAQLERARWDLEETTVRAPTDGLVTQLLLRPGMMAVPLPLRPVMTFIHTEKGDRAFVGAFWQNSLQRLDAGDHAEIIFKALPGRVFQGKVERFLPVLAQGQLQTSGDLQSVESVPVPGQVPVVIRLDSVLSDFDLPAGIVGTGAIYTEHAHHLALLRKILLRMVSWQNYIFGELH